MGSSLLTRIAPGDVIACRTDNKLISNAIRFAAALRGEPNLVNHVVIAHHQDSAGNWIGIEGRPGGVGYVDLRVYDNEYALSNSTEPKTVAQRATVLTLAEHFLGAGYDWAAIGLDGLQALHLMSPEAGKDGWYGTRGHYYPDRVLCSNYADWVYARVCLTHPGNGRATTPADWYQLFLDRGWS